MNDFLAAFSLRRVLDYDHAAIAAIRLSPNARKSQLGDSNAGAKVSPQTNTPSNCDFLATRQASLVRCATCDPPPYLVAPPYRVGLPCIVLGILAQCTNIWYRTLPGARNTRITRGPHFDEPIAAQVANGRYGSASQVVRAGLRPLEETDTRLDPLRRLFDEGEQSGIANDSLESIITERDNEAR